MMDGKQVQDKELIQILEKKSYHHAILDSCDVYMISVFKEDSCSPCHECHCTVYDDKIIFKYRDGVNSVETEITSVLELEHCLRFVGLYNIIDKLFD